MRSYDVRIDVTGGLGQLGDLQTAATVHLPDRIDEPVSVMVGYPGGGYSRGYYDIRKLPGYSQAQYHTSRGYVFVACDHFGIGDSTPVDPQAITYERVTAANHITAATIVERLRNGTLIGGVAPVEVEKVIGMGQSMGGCFLIVQQAVHRTFDAIAILGYASVRSGFPTPNGAMSPSPVMNLDALRFAFHAPDEDSRLVEADFPSVMPAAGHQQPWRASAMPAIAVEGAVPGAVSTEAAAIDVPVLLAYGETDLVANPWIEPSGFSKSRDVSLFVVPRMAHMHNFAQTRMLLWQRIDHFACCA